VDGQSDANRTCTPDPIDFVGGYDDDKVNIGRVSVYEGSPVSDWYMMGQVDDVRIYDRALSAEEIAEIYESAMPVNYYYVDGIDGDDLNDGLTLETAFATIQKGADEANDADTVLVYPAVYAGPVGFDGKAITVQGVAGAGGAAVISAPGNYAVSCFSDEDANSILKNFVIKGSFVGVFLVDASPTLAHLTVVDNNTGVAGYSDSEPHISNCIFYNNDEDLFGCEAQYSFTQDGITDGLVAHWKFDEGQGSIAYDSAGDNDGTIYGAQWASGQVGGALELDGTNDYVGVPDDDSQQISTDQISLSAWVSLAADVVDPQRRIICKQQMPDIAWGLEIFGEGHGGSTGNQVAFHDSDGASSYYNCVSPMDLGIDEWHHIAVTDDAGVIRIYLNGLLDKLSDQGYGIPENISAPIMIGRTNPESVFFFEGTIDDVQIYDRALSEGEVKRVYREGLGPRFVDADAGDYHLKSEGWRWAGDAVWMWDDVSSPCIDSGNPGTPLGDEPESIERDPDNVWGVNIRVNMGAYGGTSQASMGPHGWAMLADLNNDGIVDWLDVGLYAQCWLSADYEPAGDLNRDGTVDMSDWALLGQDWSQQTIWR
jgi:hypothetical protein